MHGFYSMFSNILDCMRIWTSHLLTLTQLAEESTALTVCPFGQKARRGGDYKSSFIYKNFDSFIS